MNRLTLDSFLYVTDFELSQYRILDCLKKYNSDFHQSKLYPALSELSELNLILKEIDKHETHLNDLFIQQFYKKSTSDDGILVEPVEITDSEFENVLELIEWSKPLIKDTIAEGKVLYDFVKKNIKIEQIGAIDYYQDDGYILIPDNKESVLQLLEYEISTINTGTRNHRKLNTYLLQTIHKSLVDQSPEKIIVELFKQHKDMPDSTTFICNTDLDFPFTETILPVAKRKLMSRMAA
jgi:hypothetical protein